ncbi:hypothetical protein [Streptomyces bugieae]|uniref:Uncharacterized protein n=1 Tax=Streptomyces bugieae TaxID=3098223 RepID=A0ABU7NL60_9ACTN|nr:hypothetical protein [Streptomyces sp. DSM 41528]
MIERLCTNCKPALLQGSLEDDWLAAGLITAEQRDNLRANTYEEAS